MSELSPRASALLEAARRSPRVPSQEAVERVERAVMIATGVTAAAAGAGAAKTASAWALSATGKGVLGALALTMVGAAVTVSVVRKQVPVGEVRPSPLPLSPLPQGEGKVEVIQPPSLPLSAQRATAPGPMEAGAGVAGVAGGAGGAGERGPIRKPSPQPTQPQPTEQLTPPPSPRPLVGLGSEVALLQSAKSKLEAGDWVAAQSLLDQHHAEFPTGALSLEADVLRVLTWCGDGRLAEASELAARVRERAPRSPATARLAGSCVDQ